MISAPRPTDEEERLRKLHSYGILDTAAEKAYDDIVRLVAAICGTPIATISLIDGQRQWLKAAVGLENRETPRDVAFCSHAILTDELLMVEDALGDDRFVDNPLVTGEPHIRFYAGMPLVTPDGYRLGALCAIDTTPRVLSEDQKVALGVLSRHVVDLLELRLRNRELKEVSEYKSRLLAIIAHDMRSPLNNLTSLLRLLEVATISNEQEKDLFGDLDRAMQATRGLLDNLTEWVTRILDGGANSVCPERFDLRETVSSLVDQVKPRGAAKGVTLENRIPEGVEIESDRGILRFILRNLMDNAIKYSPGGRVTVTAEGEGGALGISVRDTGVGMSPEKLSELFKWHERSPVPGTDGERGSGIALMLSAEMASLVGAALSAESTLGEGTTVTLTIPFSQGA